MASDGTSIYAFGGNTIGGSQHAEANKYNPTTNTWTALASLTTGPDYLFHAEYGNNGKIYVMGGLTGGTLNRIYDIATNSYSAGAPVPVAVYDQGHAYWNGKVYVIGGIVAGVPGMAPGFVAGDFGDGEAVALDIEEGGGGGGADADLDGIAICKATVDTFDGAEHQRIALTHQRLGTDGCGVVEVVGANICLIPNHGVSGARAIICASRLAEEGVAATRGVASASLKAEELVVAARGVRLSSLGGIRTGAPR